MVTAFSKPAGLVLATKVEILVLLEGLLQVKALWFFFFFSNFLIEGDFDVVIF